MTELFTITSSPAMQAKEEADEREHLALVAASDSVLIGEDAGPHWRAVERAEEVLDRVDTAALATVRVLDGQNDARGREIQRLRARIAEALELLDAGPQMVNDRVEQHWSVVAHGAATILRGTGVEP